MERSTCAAVKIWGGGAQSQYDTILGGEERGEERGEKRREEADFTERSKILQALHKPSTLLYSRAGRQKSAARYSTGQVP